MLLTFSLDLETDHLDPAVGSILAVCVSDGSRTGGWWVDSPEALKRLRTAFRRLTQGAGPGPVVLHNAKFDLGWAERFLGVSGWQPSQVIDTMLLARRVAPTASSKLGDLVARHLPQLAGYKGQTDALSAQGKSYGEFPRDLLLQRCAIDAWATLKLAEILTEKLSPEERELHSEDVAIALATDRIAQRGLWVDQDEMAIYKVEQEALAAGFLSTAREITGDADFNPSSWQQVQHYLRKLDCPVPKTDKVTLRVAQLDKADEKTAVLIDAIVRYRAAVKQVSTYVRGYLKRLSSDGYLRGDLRWPGTDTFRPACSDPNLLNIPRGRFRDVFSAPEGQSVFEVDLSQLQFRVAARLSGDPVMLHAYENNIDLHQVTATNINAPRYVGKAANFKLFFGMSKRRFRMDLIKDDILLSQREASSYHSTYWQTYSTLDNYAKSEMKRVENGEPLVAPTGAYRWTLEDALLKHPGKKDDALRFAFNAPIQSVDARITGRLAVKAEREGIDIRLTTYDGVVGYAPTGDVQDVSRRVQELYHEECQEDWWQGLPVPADRKIGPSWGQAKEMT